MTPLSGTMRLKLRDVLPQPPLRTVLAVWRRVEALGVEPESSVS